MTDEFKIDAANNVIALYPAPYSFTKETKKDRAFWVAVGLAVWGTIYEEYDDQPLYVQDDIAELAVHHFFQIVHGKRAFGREERFTYVILPRLRKKRDFLRACACEGLGGPHRYR